MQYFPTPTLYASIYENMLATEQNKAVRKNKKTKIQRNLLQIFAVVFKRHIFFIHRIRFIQPFSSF